MSFWQSFFQCGPACCSEHTDKHDAGAEVAPLQNTGAHELPAQALEQVAALPRIAATHEVDPDPIAKPDASIFPPPGNQGLPGKAAREASATSEVSSIEPRIIPNPKAVCDTTLGKFELEIYLDRVPITASNFVDLAQTSFYDGLHFHRIIPGFMAQFGCPLTRDLDNASAGNGRPDDGLFQNLRTGKTEKRRNGYIKDENISKDTNAAGTISMANAGRPNSGGSQFFINVADNEELDWFTPGPSKHPVFGKVTKGMDVISAIVNVPTKSSKPCLPIMMRSIVIEGVD